MRAKERSWVALVALSLFWGFTAAASGAEPQPPLSVQWVYSMEPDPASWKAPLITPGRVYVTNGGTLRCLDSRTGGELWKFIPVEARVTTSPVSWQDLVIVGATDSSVYALKAETGEEAWKQPCAGSVGGDPIILDDLVVFGAQNLVYALVPSDGRPAWACTLTSPVSEGPIAEGAMLYFLCQNGSLQCVDPSSGRFRWDVLLRTGPRAFAPIAGDRRVFVAGGNRIISVNSNGGVSWTAEMPAGIGGRPTLVGDTLYVPCVNGVIYAIHGRSGTPQRGAALQISSPATSAPLVLGGTMFIGSGNALVYALDVTSSAVQWLFRCVEPDQDLGAAATWGIYAPVEAGEGALYCLTGGGSLYSFSPAAPDATGPIFSNLKPEQGEALPGKQPVEVSFAVTDSGSGVDPATVEVTLDGQAVSTQFAAASATGSFRVSSPNDGSHIVKVTARDFRGNTGTTEWSFLTDTTIAPPEGERTPTSTLRGRPGPGGR